MKVLEKRQVLRKGFLRGANQNNHKVARGNILFPKACHNSHGEINALRFMCMHLPDAYILTKSAKQSPTYGRSQNKLKG